MSYSSLFVYGKNFKGVSQIELCKSYKSYPKVIRHLTKKYLGVAEELPSADTVRELQRLIEGENGSDCDRVMFHLVCQSIFHVTIYKHAYTFIDYIKEFVDEHKLYESSNEFDFISALMLHLGVAIGNALKDDNTEDSITFSVKATSATDEREDLFRDGIPTKGEVCNIITFNDDKSVNIRSNSEFFNN